MAKYYGTFSCGHEGYVNIIGPMKDRQWKADRAFSNMCEECYREHLEKERLRENKEALEKSKEMELPELTGSEKQIAWANTLRIKLMNDLKEFAAMLLRGRNVLDYKDKILEKGLEMPEAKEMLEGIEDIIDYIIINKTEAKFFIDNRDKKLSVIIDIYKEMKELQSREEIKDIIDEATISPIEVKHNGVVEIKYNKDKIEVTYEKNEDFRLLVKSLGYKWNNGWSRNINELTGSYKDRVAELGNKLLNAGFSILILDEELRIKAINADYEVECDRWIQCKEDKPELLLIRWWDRDEKLYSTARKLRGSKWSNPYVTVNISHYKEVEEFAKLYEFKFTIAARDYIEKYKEEIGNLTTVEVANSKEYIKKDGLEEILNSSREILDDLMEDE